MLRALLQKEISRIVGPASGWKLFEPEREENGDYSTNAAFKVGKAEAIAEKLRKSELVKEVAVKNKFINIFLKDEVLLKALGEKVEFPKKKEKVNVEFVSANPTGPLTMANARGGFFGDVLSKILKLRGLNIEREYYVNDAGNQMRILGLSILAAAGKTKDDESYYHGDHLVKWGKDRPDLLVTHTEAPEFLGRYAARDFLDSMIRPSISKMGIDFDRWTFEYKDICEKKYIDKAINLFEKKNLLYESEGARWLKTTEFGDDKDRVLVTSDRFPTYFLVDAGHYLATVEHGISKKINILGADHYGYVSRIQAVAKIIGLASDIIVIQLVRLVSEGKEIRMSKRTGKFVTLDELLDEVGLDAARWFFLSHAPETHMDFDLDLAKERSEKNPVYYVQYAHTRMASILGKSKVKSGKLKVFSHPAERALVMKILRYPELLEDISRDYQVHRLTTYAYELAQTFSAFYRDVKVLGSEREAELLYLVSRAKETLADLLKIMGISQPEKM